MRFFVSKPQLPIFVSGPVAVSTSTVSIAGHGVAVLIIRGIIRGREAPLRRHSGHSVGVPQWMLPPPAGIRDAELDALVFQPSDTPQELRVRRERR